MDGELLKIKLVSDLKLQMCAKKLDTRTLAKTLGVHINVVLRVLSDTNLKVSIDLLLRFTAALGGELTVTYSPTVSAGTPKFKPARLDYDLSAMHNNTGDAAVDLAELQRRRSIGGFGVPVRFIGVNGSESKQWREWARLRTLLGMDTPDNMPATQDLPLGLLGEES